MAHILLVHGAMHGAWCWAHVTPLLAGMGHMVEAIDLPGQGEDPRSPEAVTLDDWGEAVAVAIRSLPAPVIVVGHSMGGTAISMGAERAPDHVAGLIYLSAIMIEDGETIFSACPEIIEIAQEVFRTSESPADAATKLFYGSTPHVVAIDAIGRLRPEAKTVSATPVRLTQARYGRIRRAYIECSDDIVCPLAVQRRMQRRLPCDPVATMPGDHSPFLSAPSLLAQHIDRIARQF